MCWLKIKKPREKRTLTIAHRSENFTVGKTDIKIKLKDGREYIHSVIGRLDQYVEYGMDETHYSYGVSDMKEPYVTKPRVIPSTQVAQQQLHNYPNGEGKIHLSPDHMVYGWVIEAELVSSDATYETSCNVAYLAPQESK